MILMARELLIEQIPQECIEDCTIGGQDTTPMVEHWRKRLDFQIADRERTIKALENYGAWEREEMDTWSDEKLAETVLWLACNDFSEYLSWRESHPLTPEDECPAGSSSFYLE